MCLQITGLALIFNPFIYPLDGLLYMDFFVIILKLKL